MRIKYNIMLSLSEDATAANELGQTSPWFGVTDAIEDGGTFRRTIDAGAMDVAISFNGISANLLGIKSDQTISFKKNSSGGEPTTVQALGVGATDAIMILTTTGITSIYVTNPGAVNAEVTFYVAGSD